MTEPSADLPDKPFGNCYWVQPGRFLAGEYPAGRTPAETTARLRRLIDIGINTFIDLTAEGEQAEYASILPEISGGPLRHQRFTIPDHAVPTASKVMSAALNAIDQALAQGQRVYLHCRAGIGRTGMVVGCHLTRQGRSGEAALTALNDLWQDCERSHAWPTIPETPEQMNYVIEWQESAAERLGLDAASKDLMDRYEGALFGLAIGDAMGSRSKAGVWGNNTAMTCCLAASLIERGSDPASQMQHYLRWLRQGEYSANNQAPDAPKEVQRAVAAWQWSGKTMAGSHDPSNLDAHPLARTTAVALRHAGRPALALQAAADACRTTLQSPVALDACRVFAALLMGCLQGLKKNALDDAAQNKSLALLHQQKLKPQLAALFDGGRRASSSGMDIVSVLAQAWHVFVQSESFSNGLSMLVKSQHSSASAGAVYGALAGAHYGIQALPKDWRERVAQSSLLSRLVIGLFEQAAKQ